MAGNIANGEAGAGLVLSANLIATQTGMQLGAFSINIGVKDIKASQEFYERLGFAMVARNVKSWLLMKNGDLAIWLHRGGFTDEHLMSFHIGLNHNDKTPAEFTDLRELQKQLKAKGVKLAIEADEATKGPASFVVVDPDGNQILLKQHV